MIAIVRFRWFAIPTRLGMSHHHQAMAACVQRGVRFYIQEENFENRGLM